MSFREVSDAEDVGAAAHEVAGDGFEAVAVGIGFHDREDSDMGSDVLSDGGEVMAEGVEVDFGPAAGCWGGRGGHCEGEGSCDLPAAGMVRGGGALTNWVSRR